MVSKSLVKKKSDHNKPYREWLEFLLKRKKTLESRRTRYWNENATCWLEKFQIRADPPLRIASIVGPTVNNGVFGRIDGVLPPSVPELPTGDASPPIPPA